MVHLLIDKGANLNAVDANGQTALDAALDKSNEGTFRQ